MMLVVMPRIPLARPSQRVKPFLIALLEAAIEIRREQMAHFDTDKSERRG